MERSFTVTELNQLLRDLLIDLCNGEAILHCFVLIDRNSDFCGAGIRYVGDFLQ